jgi:ssDNA-binding Zn-finger/Zn-ribbon topoisomerase 1
MAIFVMCSNAPLKCKHTELLPPKFGVDPRTGEPAIINKCPECNYIFIQSKIHAQGDCLPADAPVRNRLSEVFQKGK